MYVSWHLKSESIPFFLNLNPDSGSSIQGHHPSQYTENTENSIIATENTVPAQKTWSGFSPIMVPEMSTGALFVFSVLAPCQWGAQPDSHADKAIVML